MLRRLAVFAACVGLAASAGPSPGQPPNELKELEKLLKQAADKSSDSPDKKFPDFAVVTKGAKVTEGLFTLHQKDDHVYMEIRPDQFDRPYLLPISVAKGAGMGGDTLDFGEEWVVSFKRVDDRVFVVRKNTRFRANPGTPAAKAVETAYSDSVLLSVPVRTLNPAKGSVVIDLNQVFFGDLAQLNLGSLDASRSSWHKLKGYKRNVELEVSATFGGGRYGRFFSAFGDDGAVIDPRGTTVIIHYGLVEMPEGGYQPRVADNRVGHFLSAVKDFSKSDPETNFVRLVTRWRLERADGSPYKAGGRAVPPKKRIVFWIEDSVPDEYRTAVREGILEWNKAFEKIGFKDAIEVRQQDGQDFDPEDTNYATFRWTTRDGGGAIGPSRANPLTGEIIDADILFDGSFVQYYKEEFRLFRDATGKPVEPASLLQAYAKGFDLPPALPPDPSAPGAALRWDDTARRRAAGVCRCGAHKSNEIAVGAMALLGAIDADDKDAKDKKDADKEKSVERDRDLDELIQQGIKETTMHEVGHTLGLRHNFKASAMLSNDKLHDTSVTRKVGLVGSVMDYSPVNIAPKGTKQGDYFTTVLGPYDFWAIEYAYTPNASDDDLKKIAAKAPLPELIFGTDEDLYGGADPYINLWDLGSDPLQFGKDRVKLAAALIPTLADRAVNKGEGYARLRRAFSVLLGQYGNAAYLAGKYVGGASVNRDRKGDPKGRDPIQPVAPSKQREALEFLKTDILTDKPFDIPPELLRKLTVEKWYHWGAPYSYGGRADFPLTERVLAIQEVALDELLSADTLRRVQDMARATSKRDRAEKADEPLAVAEIFRALTDAVFADLPLEAKEPKDGEKAATSSVIARNLQRAYVARLAGMVLGPKADTSFRFFVVFLSGGGGEVPADAKSLARFHLKEVAKRLDAGLKLAKDDTTRAFLEETRERVAKVLDAKLAMNEP